MRRIAGAVAILGLGTALLLGATSHAWAGQYGGRPTYRVMGLGGWATWPNWAGTSWNWVQGWPYTTTYDWPNDNTDHPPAYVRGLKVTPTWIDAYTPRPAPFYMVPLAAPVVTAPVVSARSVATGGIGMQCSTAITTCALRRAASLGSTCSCKVTGGPARGSVTP